MPEINQIQNNIITELKKRYNISISKDDISEWNSSKSYVEKNLLPGEKIYHTSHGYVAVKGGKNE